MNGLEGRTNILLSLATALRASPNLFGDDGRPGNLLGEIRSGILFRL
jgi:hypothetical protein